MRQVQVPQYAEPVSYANYDDIWILLNKIMEIIQNIHCSTISVCATVDPYDDGFLLCCLGRVQTSWTLLSLTRSLPHIQIQAVLALIIE